MSERRYVHISVLKREKVDFKQAAAQVKSMTSEVRWLEVHFMSRLLKSHTCVHTSLQEDSALPASEAQTMLRIVEAIEELQRIEQKTKD